MNMQLVPSNVESAALFVEVDLEATEKKLEAYGTDQEVPTFGLMVMFHWLSSLPPPPNLPELGVRLRRTDPAESNTTYTLPFHISRGSSYLKTTHHKRELLPINLSAAPLVPSLPSQLSLNIQQQSRQALQHNSRHTSGGFLWGRSIKGHHVVFKEDHPFWLSLSTPFQLLCRHSPADHWCQLHDALTQVHLLPPLPATPPPPSPSPLRVHIARSPVVAGEVNGHPCASCKPGIELLRQRLRQAEERCRGRDCLPDFLLESSLDRDSYAGEEGISPVSNGYHGLH